MKQPETRVVNPKARMRIYGVHIRKVFSAVLATTVGARTDHRCPWAVDWWFQAATASWYFDAHFFPGTGRPGT
jgi:hypothetical protein